MTKSFDREQTGRLLAATDRCISGARLCLERINSIDAAGARDIGGVPLVNLVGSPTHDLDYWLYESFRLQDVADEVKKLDDPHTPSITAALAELDRVCPRLRSMRNAITHIDEPDHRLANTSWFGPFLIRRLPGGNVEYLIDIRPDEVSAALESVHRAVFGRLTDHAITQGYVAADYFAGGSPTTTV